MNKEKPPVVVTEPVNDPCWCPRFRELSWWEASDKRVFVVLKQHLKWNSNTELESIDLLEQNKENPITRPWPEIHSLFCKGMLRCISTSSN